MELRLVISLMPLSALRCLADIDLLGWAVAVPFCQQPSVAHRDLWKQVLAAACRNGCAAVCAFLLWDVLLVEVPRPAESYNVYLYVWGMPFQFQKSLCIDSVSQAFPLQLVEVVIHQVLIGTRWICGHLTGASLQLELPDTNAASLLAEADNYQGIQLSCISNQYLLL